MMKRGLYVAILIFLLAGRASLAAQQGGVDLNKKVQLSSRELTVDSLLSELSRQSGIRFSFNSRRILPSKKVLFSSRSITTGEVLRRLNSVLSIKYKLLGGHVILIDDPKKSFSQKNERKQAASSKKKPAPTKKDTSNLTGESVINPVISAIEIESAESNNETRKDTAVSKERMISDLAPDRVLTAQPISTPLLDSSTRNFSVTPNEQGSTSNVNVSKRVGEASFLKKFQIEMGPRGVGLNYETRLGGSTTLEVATGLGAGYLVTGKWFYYSFQVSDPALYLSVRPKFFLGQGSPFFIGLQTKFHSAQLFSNTPRVIDSAAKWVSAKGYTNAAIFFDVHAGYQKQIGDRWRFGSHVGIGYSFSTQSRGLNHWFPALDVKFTYRLRR